MSTHTASDQHLERDGARLRWRLEGNGPALVLLHGWAMDLDCWQPVMASLAARFTVLRFDRRGFGLSSGTPDIHRNVDDLLALLDNARQGRVILVGLSQGARLALHFACRHPARVRGLVLDGAPAFDADPELPLDHYRQLLRESGPAALRMAIARHPLLQLHGGGAAARELLAGMLARYRGLDLLQPPQVALPPEPGQVLAPTLVITGRHDSQARHEAADALRAGITGARQAQLPGGHLAVLEAPDAWASVVAEFCATLPA